MTTTAERSVSGKAVRLKLPLDANAETARGERGDPVVVLGSDDQDRLTDLVPIRYGRMVATPFAFYRGAAALMARDLGALPNSGLYVQLCGDAHLSNFGLFGTPERRLIFDVNDFDETLPGPFEWDLKRLAASIEIASRGNGFRRKERRSAVLEAVSAYREAMRAFAGMTTLAVWYASADMDDLMERYGRWLTKDQYRQTQLAVSRARRRDSLHAMNVLTETANGQPHIKSQPPFVVPIEELSPEVGAVDFYAWIGDVLRSYARSLPPARRHLIEQYRLVHMARKVVGVGSVGRRAWVVLLVGSNDGDALVLQAKEAAPSVLAPFVRRSRYRNQGQRVVVGQQLVQASSDIFLGWQRATEADGVSRDFYVRQMYDWKGAFPVERMESRSMAGYGRLCGWTLARAHARSGDRVAIAAYLGRRDMFDQAVADFAAGYADLNEQDHAALVRAVESGRVAAHS